MAISRWYPIREMATLQNRVNSIFQDFAGENESVTTASFVPAVDVFENNEKIVLKLEIPGVKEEDVDIRVENQQLTCVVSASSIARRRKKISIALSAGTAAFSAPSLCRPRSIRRMYRRVTMLASSRWS